MAARKTAKPLTFEEGLARLETIADALEHNELPLEELLKLHEEGVKLAEELTQKLDAAEGRMTEVRKSKNGQAELVSADVVQQGSLLDGLDGKDGLE